MISAGDKEKVDLTPARAIGDIAFCNLPMSIASLRDATNLPDNLVGDHENRWKQLTKAREFHERVISRPKKSSLLLDAAQLNGDLRFASSVVQAAAAAASELPTIQQEPSSQETSPKNSKANQVSSEGARNTANLFIINNNKNTQQDGNSINHNTDYNENNNNNEIDILNRNCKQEEQHDIAVYADQTKNTQNPRAKLTKQQSKSFAKRYRRWKLKFWMSFCCMGYQKNKASIADVAKLLSRLYSGPNMGLSHIAACVILLKNFQEAQQNWMLEQPQLGVKQFLSCIPITDKTPFLDLSTEEDSFIVTELIYYMNYSLSIFGWPLYAIDGFHQVCCLFPYLKLQCCRSNKIKTKLVNGDKQQQQDQINFDFEDFPIVIDDNFVGCNVAAANRRLNGHNYDIIYVNYQSAINVVPFIVVADHSKQTVVVGIRGSMALSDAVIDLNVMIEPLPLQPEKPEMYGHRGMILSANYIRETMKKHQVLEAAFGSRPDLGSENYTLLFCGHSLGGGLASILGLLYQKEYPNLKAYLYSPPGGILSLAAIEETKKFALGVFLGNDCIPRAGLTQIERLKYQSFWAKKRIQQSNGRILASAFGRKFCCCGGDSATATSANSGGVYQFDPAYSLDICFGQKENCPPFEYKGQVFEFPAREEALFVPGKLIHVVKDFSKSKLRHATARNPYDNEPFYRAIWVENTNYDRIVIDEGMLMDHMPFALMQSMKMLFSRTIPPPKTKQPKSIISLNQQQPQQSWFQNSSIRRDTRVIVSQEQILGTQSLINNINNNNNSNTSITLLGNNNNNEDKILIADEEANEKQRQYQHDGNNNDDNNNNNNNSQSDYYKTNETDDHANNTDNNNNLNFANLNSNSN